MEQDQLEMGIAIQTVFLLSTTFWISYYEYMMQFLM